MNSIVRTIIFWVVILLSAVALWQVVKTANPGEKVEEINFSRFMSEVDQGTVKDVTLRGMQVKGKRADGSEFHSTVPANYPDMIKELHQKNVSITVEDVGNSSWGINLVIPLALLAALVYFLSRTKFVQVRSTPSSRAFRVNSTVKTIIFWVVIVISALALWQVVKTANAGEKVEEINFSRFMSEVDQGTVKDVTLRGMEVKGKRADGSEFHSTVPANYPDMIKELHQKNVSITVR